MSTQHMGLLGVGIMYISTPAFTLLCLAKARKQPHHNFLLRYALDPYALLALLGFLIFLFYVIYSFLNVTSGRSFATSPWKELFDLLGSEDWLRYEATF